MIGEGVSLLIRLIKKFPLLTLITLFSLLSFISFVYLDDQCDVSIARERRRIEKEVLPYLAEGQPPPPVGGCINSFDFDINDFIVYEVFPIIYPFHYDAAVEENVDMIFFIGFATGIVHGAIIYFAYIYIFRKLKNH